MRILLTNDDGIQAVGLRALFKALTDAGHDVHAVAPVTEMSAVGHAITIATPLRVKQFRENGFQGLGVYGTPADCVKLAITTLLASPPDMVVSGINAGANVGIDILYSGTVSAATEGALMGFPALAVSHDEFNPVDQSWQAGHAASFIKDVDWSALPPRRVLNLNYPACPPDQVKPLTLCPHTDAVYDDYYHNRRDPRGRPYYWLTGAIPAAAVQMHSDRALLTDGHITLTPLKFDFTDHETLAALRKTL